MTKSREMYYNDAVEAGSELEFFISMCRQLGCVVAEENITRNIVIGYPGIGKVRVTRKKVPRGDVPDHLKSWYLELLDSKWQSDPMDLVILRDRLDRTLDRGSTRRLHYAYTEVEARVARSESHKKKHEEQERQRKQREAQEAERKAREAQERAEREAEEMRRSEETKGRKLALKKMLFAQAERLKMDDLDLGKLLGVDVRTVTLWRLDPNAIPNPSIETFEQWIDLLQREPTPETKPAMHPAQQPQPVVTYKPQPAGDGVFKLTLALQEPISMVGVKIDLKTMGEEDLFVLRNQVDTELIRRMRTGRTQ